MLATVKEGRTTTSVVAAEEYTTEFRAYNDDAWYTVRVLLEGERLIVKYQNFSDETTRRLSPRGLGIVRTSRTSRSASGRSPDSSRTPSVVGSVPALGSALATPSPPTTFASTTPSSTGYAFSFTSLHGLTWCNVFNIGRVMVLSIC